MTSACLRNSIRCIMTSSTAHVSRQAARGLGPALGLAFAVSILITGCGNMTTTQVTSKGAKPETTTPHAVTVQVGDTVHLTGSSGAPSADVTVTRKETSGGGEFDQPSNGVYVALYVRVRAHEDGITVPDFYGLINGKHYDTTCCVDAFQPDLDTSVDLNNGETAEGWVVLDVPSSAGELVLEDFGTGKPQAVWKF